jgi:hypothetical protein
LSITEKQILNSNNDMSEEELASEKKKDALIQ